MNINYPDGYHVYFDKFIDSWVAEKDGKIVKSSENEKEVRDWIKKKVG